MSDPKKDFLDKLNLCTTKTEVEALIEDIDDDSLYLSMLDKYNQILEFNKDEDIKSIKKILEYKCMNFDSDK